MYYKGDEVMRTKKSIRNVIIAMIMNIIIVLIGLLAQKIFLDVMNTEYLGINGLFSNIVSMLSMADLGIGAAIIYNLYKPLAQHDTEKIKSLMKFYKLSYRCIAVIILFIGICLLPFLNKIVGQVEIPENIYIIYLMFLVDVIFSYLLTYKRSLLYANQDNYIINIVHIVYLIVMNTLQLTLLILTKNYYIYLLIKIIMRLLENIVLTIIANKKYSILLENNAKGLDKETKKDIFKKVKALMFHKVGSFVVSGTDNIIISTFLGVSVVGLYSNYNLIITTLSNFVMQIFNSITASVGNLLTIENNQKNYSVYRRIRFINFWISSFTAIGFLVCMNSFVTIWIGNKYLLSDAVLIVLSINLFLTLFRYSITSFKEAGGIFYEDRFVPLIEASTNLIMSLIFLKLFGLMGVFMGTICSNLVLHLYSYPKYVYKKLFGEGYLSYYKEFFKYFSLAIVIGCGTYIVSKIFVFNSIWSLVIDVLICLIIPNLIYFILFRNSKELNYFLQLLKKMLKKIKFKVVKS